MKQFKTAKENSSMTDDEVKLIADKLTEDCKMALSSMKEPQKSNKETEYKTTKENTSESDGKVNLGKDKVEECITKTKDIMKEPHQSNKETGYKKAKKKTNNEVKLNEDEVARKAKGNPKVTQEKAKEKQFQTAKEDSFVTGSSVVPNIASAEL